MSRRRSLYLTNQGSEGTCYAHAAARLITRFIKIKKGFVYKEVVEINKLYNTVECRNIFVCLVDQDLDVENLDDSEILSALLFNFIYTLIVSKFGIKGGVLIYSIIYFTEEIRKIDKDYIIKILKYEVKYSRYFKYIDDVLVMLTGLDTSDLTNLRRVILNNNAVDNLLGLLDQGYYSTISIENGSLFNHKGHDMVIASYEINEYGAVRLLIKNSSEKLITHSNFENSEKYIDVDDLYLYEKKIYILINPTILQHAIWVEPPKLSVFYFKQLNETENGSFLFLIRCILWFILSKCNQKGTLKDILVALKKKQLVIKKTRLDSRDNNLNMECKNERSLNICEVLKHLMRYTGKKGKDIKIIQLADDDPEVVSTVICKAFISYGEKNIRMPKNVIMLCDMLIEPNNVKISRWLFNLFNFRNLTEKERTSCKRNGYRLRKWRIPFFTNGGKKKHANRLKTKKK